MHRNKEAIRIAMFRKEMHEKGGLSDDVVRTIKSGIRHSDSMPKDHKDDLLRIVDLAVAEEKAAVTS